MKKYNILLIILVVGFITTALVLLQACKKGYGYDFDNGYTTDQFTDTSVVDIDTSVKVDKSKYIQAAVFPGMMGIDEPVYNDVRIDIDLDYINVPSSDLRISVAPGNWQSTGLWAPAGALVEIKVPDGVYGLTAQIGSQTDNLTGKAELKRDPVMYNRKQLYPGVNYVRNLYGGLIYIIPAKPLGKTIPVYFSNVAKSASFFLGKTTSEEWKEMVEKTTVPWFELVGKRIVFTLEVAKLKLYPIENPTSLMETWDETIQKAYWDWYGLTEDNPNPKHRAPVNQWRVVHDVQPSAGAQHSGFPVVATNTNGYFQQAVTESMVRNSNWGTYHELGHNMQMGSTWSFDGNGEVTNNLFSYKVANLNGHRHSNYLRAWPKAIKFLVLDSLQKRWRGNDPWPGSSTATSNPYNDNTNEWDPQLMLYAQIFEYYGFDFMTYLATAARNARFTAIDNQSKVDFFYERLSEFTHKDMYRFIREWGLTVSQTSRNAIINKGFPPLDVTLWLFDPYTHTGAEIIPRERIEHSRTEWTIDSVTNVRSPYDTYKAENVLDGNPSTVWSSCFNGCYYGPPTASSYPFVMQFKTGETPITADGFYIQQRSQFPTTQLDAITIEISNDRVNWETLGTYNLIYGNADPETLAKQYIDLPEPKTFLYFRYKWNIPPGEQASNKNSSFAEAGTFHY